MIAFGRCFIFILESLWF